MSKRNWKKCNCKKKCLVHVKLDKNVFVYNFQNFQFWLYVALYQLAFNRHTLLGQQKKGSNENKKWTALISHLLKKYKIICTVVVNFAADSTLAPGEIHETRFLKRRVTYARQRSARQIAISCATTFACNCSGYIALRDWLRRSCTCVYYSCAGNWNSSVAAGFRCQEVIIKREELAVSSASVACHPPVSAETNQIHHVLDVWRPTGISGINKRKQSGEKISLPFMSRYNFANRWGFQFSRRQTIKVSWVNFSRLTTQSEFITMEKRTNFTL